MAVLNDVDDALSNQAPSALSDRLHPLTPIVGVELPGDFGGTEGRIQGPRFEQLEDRLLDCFPSVARLGISLGAAAVTAVAHVVPDFLPFLAPGDAAAADRTGFGRESVVRHGYVDNVFSPSMRPDAVQRPTPLATVPDACYLCGSDALRMRFPARGRPAGLDAQAFNCTSFGHRAHPPIWTCEQCGLLFQWPMPANADLIAAYQDVEDPLYVAEKQNRYLTFRRVVEKLGPGRGRKLLDVGAYCGYFLDVARAADFEVEGLELSKWASAQARSLGLTLYSETLSERVRSGARYDVVTLWDVVEHFADPRAELEAAFALLAPGGRLYVSTIDAGSRVARMFGAQWPWLMDMHLFYFDRMTLRMLLESVGFRVKQVTNYTHIVSADYLLRKLGATFTPCPRRSRCP